MNPPATQGKVARSTISGRNNVIANLTVRMSPSSGIGIAGHDTVASDVLVEHVDWYGTLGYQPVAVYGNNISFSHSTVRFFGNAGVVTNIPNTPPAPQNGTQRPPKPMAGRFLEVSHCHIHDGALIGKDAALLYTGGWNAAGLVWHHNWVHGSTEKCIRCDDQGRNMSVHHNGSLPSRASSPLGCLHER